MNLDRKPIKLYKVIFNEYTNCMCNSVLAEMEYKELDLNGKIVNEGTETEYLRIPKTGTLVIREDELDLYKKFGNGFETIELVGEMYIDKEE